MTEDKWIDIHGYSPKSRAEKEKDSDDILEEQK